MEEQLLVPTRKRVEWIDILKGICAILVVLIHTQEPEVYAFLFRPFFLMTFFFASGYTTKIKQRFFGRELINTILIICIALVTHIVYCSIKYHKFLGMQHVIGAFYQNEYTYYDYPDIVWFIPCMFVAKCLFQLVLRLCRDNSVAVSIVSAALSLAACAYCRFVNIGLPWHIQTAMLSLVFMCMGYIYKRIEKYDSLILGSSSVVYIAVICFSNLRADLHLLAVSDWSTYMITAITGTVMAALLSKKISSNRLLQFIGKNSLFFFVFQTHLITEVYVCLNSLGIANESKCIISLVATLVVAFILCSLCLIRDGIYDIINNKLGKNFKPVI